MGERVERERRIALLLPVHFELVGRRVAGLAGNISRHGIYVRIDEPVPIGEVVELGIALPSGRLIQVVARAAHTLEADTAIRLGRFAGIGFEFIEHDTPALHALGEVIENVAGEVAAPIDSTLPVRVLIAESDSRLLDRMTTALDDGGYVAESATNGVEAYSRCIERRPDVILCAERMPLMGGKALETRLAKDGIDVPVLFVRKPFTDVELCSRISTALDERRTRHPRASLQVNLGEMSLGALLSFLEGGRKTGVVVASRGEQKVELRVREGRIVKVDPIGDATGRERLLELLDWIDGTFEFHAGPVEDADDVGCSISRLLLDHARLLDDLMEQTTAVRQVAI